MGKPLPCCVQTVVAAFTLFMFACVPAYPFMWMGVDVFMPVKGSTEDSFTFMMHPFGFAVLYNAGGTEMVSIKWSDLAPVCVNSSELYATFAKPNGLCNGPGGTYQIPYQVALTQASIIIAIVFIVQACLAAFCDLEGTYVLLLTVSVVFACVALGLWDQFALRQYWMRPSVFPFWNVTLDYVGEAVYCSRSRCKQASKFNVLMSNYSDAIVGMPVMRVFDDYGFGFWIAGVAILWSAYIVLVVRWIGYYLDRRQMPTPVRETEQEIVLT